MEAEAIGVQLDRGQIGDRGRFQTLHVGGTERDGQAGVQGDHHHSQPLVVPRGGRVRFGFRADPRLFDGGLVFTRFEFKGIHGFFPTPCIVRQGVVEGRL